MSDMSLRVLSVGADAGSLASALEASDNRLEVESVADPGDALRQCRSGTFDAVVARDKLPQWDPIELLESIRELDRDLPVVLYSGAGDERVASRAITAGVTDYVPTADGVDRLADRVLAAIERRTDREDASDPRVRAMDAAPIGVLIFDAKQSDNPIVSVNDRFEEMTGYDASELRGRSWPVLEGPETDRAATEELERAIADDDSVTVELRNYRRDETPFWARVTVAPLTEETDNANHYVGFYTDISDRRRQAQERQATVDLLRGIYDVTTDPDLSFESKIDRLLKLGCEALDLPYGFLSKIEPNDDSSGEGSQHIVRACGDHELLQPGETCPLSKAYCRRTIETDGLLAIQDAVAAGWEADNAYDLFELGSYVGGKVIVDGELYGTLCFAATDARDRPFSEGERTLVRLMNKWASYELERKRARERLQRQNERLEEFASIVSHDLRNPLNVAIARLDLLARECDSEHIDAITRAHDRMGALIEDLLTVAREGETATNPEPVTLGAAIKDCWQTVATEGATLSVPTERTISADPGQLQQLIENLVRNAVEHGGDDVTLTVGDLEDGFFVADDGPGIPPAEREAVLESGHTTAEDGTGYGLAIVQGIAEAHGWEITVTESESGGACFEVTGVEFV